VARYLRHDRARVRPHDGEDGVRAGNVDDSGELVAAALARHPVKVVHRLSCRADNEVAIAAKPRHGDVCLEATLRVQHARVHNRTWLHRDVVAADAVQELLRIAPLHFELCERRNVEERRAVARRGVLRADGAQPLRAPPRVRRLVLRGARRAVERRVAEVVRALPPRLEPPMRALRVERVVQRRLAQPALGGELFARPRHAVVQPERFLHSARRAETAAERARVRTRAREHARRCAGRFAGTQCECSPAAEKVEIAARCVRHEALNVDAPQIRA